MRITNLKLEITHSKEKITLPFTSIKNLKRGPKMFITACMHGDEKGSHFVAKELIKILKDKLIRGEVHVFPLLNPLGFKENSRLFNKKDLNTIFPGNKNGILAQKTANKVFNYIIQTNPDIVLDLHNDWKRSIYYALIDPKTSNTKVKAYNKTIELGKKLSVPFVLDTDNLTMSLTYNLIENNIPAITIELGESSLKKKDIEQGTKTILNLLSHLKMVKQSSKFKTQKGTKGRILIYSKGPLPKTEGKVKFLVSHGEFVKKGRALAKIINNKNAETLFSKDKALILGLTDSSIVKKGEQVIALGIIR